MGYSSMSHTSWWSAQNDNNEIHALITKEKMNDHVGVLGTGVPRLACLRPAAWLKWGPSVAHHLQHKAQDPREGPSLARRTTRRLLKHDLLRLAREEAERSRRGTSQGAHDASHDDQGCQAGASPHSVSLSSLVQRGQAQARGSSKGTHFGATRPRPVQRWEGGHHGAQDGVTTGPLAGEDQL